MASGRVYGMSHEFKQIEHSGLEWENLHPPQHSMVLRLYLFVPGYECLPS